MTKRLLSLVAVLALFLAACGDDSDSGDTEETTATTAETEATTSTTEEPEEALALDDWVEEADDICADAQDDIDDLDEPQDEEDPDEVSTFIESVLEIGTEQNDAIEELGLPDDEADAAEEALEILREREELLQEALDLIEDDDLEGAIEMFTGELPDEERLTELADDLGLEVCGGGGGGETPDTTPDTTGGGDEPFTYGDDAALDALWDACADGDPDACDDLWLEAPVDSEYEEFGYSCGGVVPEGEAQSCTDVLTGGGSSGDEPASYGDDPVLDALWDACDGGDADACDELWTTAEFGTEYYEFGFSCGGRVPEDEVEVCSEVM